MFLFCFYNPHFPFGFLLPLYCLFFISTTFLHSFHFGDAAWNWILSSFGIMIFNPPSLMLLNYVRIDAKDFELWQ
jgi:hypothetical protein